MPRVSQYSTPTTTRWNNSILFTYTRARTTVRTLVRSFGRMLIDDINIIIKHIINI